jgi:hypothetical protein
MDEKNGQAHPTTDVRGVAGLGVTVTLVTGTSFSHASPKVLQGTRLWSEQSIARGAFATRV